MSTTFQDAVAEEVRNHMREIFILIDNNTGVVELTELGKIYADNLLNGNQSCNHYVYVVTFLSNTNNWSGRPSIDSKLFSEYRKLV
jgi:hypothetical protein